MTRLWLSAAAAAVAAIAATGASGGDSGAAADVRLTASGTGNRIVIAGAGGSGRRVLGSGFESFVSPDGSRVAVIDFDQMSTGAVNWRLELFRSTGGAPLRTIKTNCHQAHDDRGQVLIRARGSCSGNGQPGSTESPPIWTNE